MWDFAFSGQALTAELLAEAEKGYTFAILAKPVHPSILLETAVKVLGANQGHYTKRQKSYA